MKRIHDGLVGRRELVGSAYLADPALRRQYDDEIAPRTVAALARVFDRLGFFERAPERVPVPPAGSAGRQSPPAQRASPARAVARVLDLGAGTGAAREAIQARFGASVEIVGVDALPGLGGATITADVTAAARPRGVEGRFDLVVAVHLLNELTGNPERVPDLPRGNPSGKARQVATRVAPRLPVETRADLVAGWCRELLEEGGLCIVIEPALRPIARELLSVRDRLVASGFEIVAPCLWQGPCPALARGRDWCHDSGAMVVPGRSRVDFSYLVVRQRREGVSGVAAGREGAAGDPSLYRVVSNRLADKGRLRLVGCGPSGRHTLMRLERDRSEANAAFGDADRGDVIRVEDAADAGDAGETVVRIGRSTAVTVRAPPGFA